MNKHGSLQRVFSVFLIRIKNNVYVFEWFIDPKEDKKTSQFEVGRESETVEFKHL